MFQYALGRALSLSRNVDLGLDLSAFEKQSSVDTPRQFALGSFRIKAAVFDRLKKPDPFLRKILRKARQRVHPEKVYVFNPRVLRTRDGTVLEGYWQSERYFADYTEEIRQEFQLKERLSGAGQTLKRRILDCATSNTITVSIHVRRGDYVNNPLTNAYHGVCGLTYYNRALSALRSSILGSSTRKSIGYFVFSDDIPWTRENIRPEGEITFVEPDSIPDFECLALMSSCQHHVISNSSFAWWGAWLNESPEKIVIAPTRWVARPGVRTDDIVPPQWVRVSNE